MTIDVTPLTSGKYKGLTPEEVADHDPGYIVRLYERFGSKWCSKQLMLACSDEMDELTAAENE